MKRSLNFDPSDEKEYEENPNAETLNAMQEAEKIAAEWRKRKHG